MQISLDHGKLTNGNTKKAQPPEQKAEQNGIKAQFNAVQPNQLLAHYYRVSVSVRSLVAFLSFSSFRSGVSRVLNVQKLALAFARPTKEKTPSHECNISRFIRSMPGSLAQRCMIS